LKDHIRQFEHSLRSFRAKQGIWVVLRSRRRPHVDAIQYFVAVQQLLSLSTSLIFAVHAVLGCSVHHACSEAQPRGEQAACGVARHHCHCHGHDHDAAPADESNCPAQCCQHVACSYVKAEQVRIDDDNSPSAPAAVLPAVALNSSSPPSFHIAVAPDIPRILSATPLYVWHCALVI
jgi:hypothetical protein